MNITYFEPDSNTPAFSLEKKISAHIKHFLVSVFILNVVLGVVYLMMLNALATQGFDMEALKAEQLKYQKEVEDIDISLAIPSSIYALESNEMVQAMVPITYKQYLSLPADKVAMKSD